MKDPGLSKGDRGKFSIANGYNGINLAQRMENVPLMKELQDNGLYQAQHEPFYLSRTIIERFVPL